MTKLNEDEVLDDGTGETTETQDEGTPQASATDFTESVKEIAKSFTDTLKEMRQAPAPADAGPDLNAIRQRVQTETNAMMEKYQELAAAGEYAKAAQYLMTEQSRIQASIAPAVKPEEDPAYRAVFKSAKRDAKREHSKVFEKFGDEIEAEIAKFAPTERLDPDTWDEAVKRVKASHIDEIIQMQVDEGNRQEQENAPATRQPSRVAPQAKGRAVLKPNEQRVELDADQKEAAVILGMSDDEYAKHVVAAESNTVKSKFGNFLSLAGEAKPKPGKF